MNTNSRCRIWGTPAREIERTIDGCTVDSPRAGSRYFITDIAEALLDRCDIRHKVRLTTWLVEQRRLGNKCPEISKQTLEEAEQWRDMAVADRADSILKYLARKSETLGARVGYRICIDLYDNVALDELDQTYYKLLCRSACVDDKDFVFILTHLEGRRLIARDGKNNREQSCTLTIEGYGRLVELERTNTDSSKAFIAMWFDDSMSEAWEHGIAPAVRDTGYDPVRIDRVEHVNKIDDEIIAEIRRARFVVADFTQGRKGARGGVYYEAGFAQGLGIPVIFCCRKDTLKKVHFDTRQYNHIVWETPEELRDQLAKRIAAVLGDGPIPPPDRAAG